MQQTHQIGAPEKRLDACVLRITCLLPCKIDIVVCKEKPFALYARHAVEQVHTSMIIIASDTDVLDIAMNVFQNTERYWP